MMTMTTMNTRQKRTITPCAEGSVNCRLVGKTGESVEFCSKHNMTTYAAADAVAAAYAGDSAYIPKKIAFIFGDSPSVTSGYTRETTWGDVKNDNSYVITGFSYAPTLSSDDDVYKFNKITFHGRTEDIPDNKYVYKACLLGKGTGGADYSLLAVVDLGVDGTYKPKPQDFEMSIDWAVKFR